MLMLVLFVTTVIVSVPDVKAASDNDRSISSAENSQDMACGQAKCGDAKEGCDKKKEGCDKSGEKKAECGK